MNIAEKIKIANLALIINAVLYFIWGVLVLSTPAIETISKVNLVLAFLLVTFFSYKIVKNKREGAEVPPQYQLILNFFRIMILLSLFVFGKKVMQYWFV